MHALGFERIAVVAPYMKPLTKLVVAYIEDAGIEVVDAVSLEIQGNSDVGRHDPMLLPAIAARMNLANAQAVVLSACVQMRSLPAIQIAEDELGLPVLSAAVATTYEILATPRAPARGAAGRSSAERSAGGHRAILDATSAGRWPDECRCGFADLDLLPSMRWGASAGSPIPRQTRTP